MLLLHLFPVYVFVIVFTFSVTLSHIKGYIIYVFFYNPDPCTIYGFYSGNTLKSLIIPVNIIDVCNVTCSYNIIQVEID